MRAGAVHGTGGRATADVHYPRGLHGLDIVRWQSRNRWSGCVSRDVLADCGAYCCGHASPEPTSHLRANRYSYRWSDCISQLYSDAAAHNGDAFCAPECAAHCQSHYGSRSDYACPHRSSDSADCDAQRCPNSCSNDGVVVSAIRCGPNQHGHHQHSRVWRDGERGADVYGVDVRCAVRGC